MARDENEILNTMLGNMRSWIEKGEGSTINQTKRAIAKELEFLEVQYDQVKADINVNTAEGAKLDSIGKIFRLPREVGETDVSYRTRITTYFQTFKETGTTKAITQAIVLSSGLDESDFSVNVIRPGLIQIVFTADLPGETVGVVKAAAAGTKKAGVVMSFQGTMDFSDSEVITISNSDSISITPVNYWEEGASLVDGGNIVL